MDDGRRWTGGKLAGWWRPDRFAKTQTRRSNARMVRWSDGSMSLQLGSDLFDVAPSYGATLARPSDLEATGQQQSSKIPTSSAASTTFICTPSQHERVLMSEAAIAGQLSLVPTSSTSKTHIELVKHVGQQHVKHSRMKILDDMKDPNFNELLAKASGRDTVKPNRPKSSARRTGGSSSRQQRHSRRHYDDDSDAERDVGTRRGGNAYEEDDGFVVADEDEEEEAEETEDEDDAAWGSSRKSKSKSKSRKRKGSDDDDEDLDEMEEAERRIEQRERERKRAKKEKKKKSRDYVDTDEEEDAEGEVEEPEEEEMDMDMESEED